VSYRYNRQGQVEWQRDQNGTVRMFEFDGLGRQTKDTAEGG